MLWLKQDTNPKFKDKDPPSPSLGDQKLKCI